MYVDDENGEIYLTPEQERIQSLEEKIEESEIKLKIYDYFVTYVKEILEDTEDNKVKEEIRMQLNDLKGELASV